MAQWQSMLDRWRAAGLLDEATAERVREWELTHGRAAGRDRLAQLAFGLGGLLLAAGVLLFVAAHWDELSPGVRFTLVLLLVGVFHAAGAVAANRSLGLSTTLHAVGTAALGAGIFLAGQIFHMAEHWPGALLMWALGAAAALVLLRDWPHVLWVAMLAPAWLLGEWIELHAGHSGWQGAPAFAGCTLLALVYLAARISGSESDWRSALTRLGAVTLIPAAIVYGVGLEQPATEGDASNAWRNAAGWAVALMLPGGLAIFLRGRDAMYLVPAVIWVVLLAAIPRDSPVGDLLTYILYALASAGLVMWGMREQQRLVVNLGVLGFALTIVFFYFASLFDRLGRSLGLIGMGVLFIAGGWLLERARRRLVERIDRSSA